MEVPRKSTWPKISAVVRRGSGGGEMALKTVKVPVSSYSPSRRINIPGQSQMLGHGLDREISSGTSPVGS